jgi:hydrogenase maturation protease
MKILVVGLGNPILGDDGVGWRVVDQLMAIFRSKTTDILSSHVSRTNGKNLIEFELLAIGGLHLMEHLVGYDYAIIVDSIIPSNGETGKVVVLSIDHLTDLQVGHMTSTHDTSLQNAMKMGRMLGAQLPDQVDIVGIKVEQNFNFSEDLSSKVEMAVPVAVEAVANLLRIKLATEEYL